MPSTLFLIDAYAMIYKAYYAFISNPMVNSKGESTSAVFGFVNSLQDIIKKESPTHLAVVFDPPFPTFRNEISPEYKAQRPPTPEGIKTGIPRIKSILQAWGIHQVEVPRFEADDTIGTLARKAAGKGFKVYMVTPDKDYKQLLKGDSIMLYRPKKGAGYDIITEKDFLDETGLESPSQFIDILALWGDAADNVKGVQGVGEKTAYKLVGLYKSMEGIYENISSLKGKIKENFIADRETALLAKRLVTIDTSAPADFVEDDFMRKDINEATLRAIFADLEFRSLADRIIGKKKQQELQFGAGTLFAGLDSKKPEGTMPAVAMKTVKDVPHEYILAVSDSEISELRDILMAQPEFCFDTETTGLSVIDDSIVGMSFAYQDHKAYFIHFSPENPQETLRRLAIIAPVFNTPAITKIGQNIKFDIMVLRKYGIQVKGPLFDTMVAHYLLQPEQKHNMDFLSEVYLQYTPVHIEQLIGGKGKSQKTMAQVPVDKITEYAAEDADITWQLCGKLRPELEKLSMLKMAEEIEMPLIYVLADMEYEGVSIDCGFLNQYSAELNARCAGLEQDIYRLAGKPFNIASPKQLGDVLFNDLKIASSPTVTKMGAYATGEEELMKYKDSSEIVSLILEYRGLKKLVSTYTEVLPGLVNPRTGRLHASFNQTITATGRLSSSNPNIQNIPARTPEGKKIREAFVPSRHGNLIYAADYSQVELRVMAHLSGDEGMISAFANGEDIHSATAAKIFHVEPAQVTREQRYQAKSANFGIIYGISAFGLSQDTGLSRQEAKQVIDSYFETYPGIRKYIDSVVEGCRQNHYVSTMFGHRREVRDIDINSRNFNVRAAAERLAVNTPVQGSAAEIIKIAMVGIFSEFRNQGLKSKLIIQVHDELVFDVYPDEKDVVEEIVVRQMENAASMKVKLKVEGKFAENWLMAH